MVVAKGLLERSIPVTLVYSAKASMIDWIVEAEDVACPVDDMRMACSSCCVQREWYEGKGER